MDRLIIINARTSNRDYKILIKPGLFNQVPKVFRDRFKGCRKLFLITDSTVYGLYEEGIKEFLEKSGLSWRIFTLDEGEEQKNIDNVKRIYSELASFNMHREDIVVAFGGGVVGDISGFVASTFHRGIKLVQFPTTLVAQVDSSIGGKTGINIDKVKNAVGTFYQPHLIIIDPLLLKTLQVKEIINGLAEIIKYGAVFDKNILAELKALAVSERKSTALKDIAGNSRFFDIIYKCCNIKAGVVKKDEYDTGFRNLLNFGHTFGHAIEKVTGLNTVSHGQAVAYGMLMAADASILLKIAPAGLKQEFTGIYDLLEIPKKMPPDVFQNGEISGREMITERIIDAMKFDKKFSSANNKFILLKGSGKPVFKYNLDPCILREAIKNNISGEAK